MTVSDILTILDLAARIGIPAVRAIVESWDRNTVTSADIEKLRDIPMPDTFK